jgi:hypothetical protein
VRGSPAELLYLQKRRRTTPPTELSWSGSESAGSDGAGRRVDEAWVRVTIAWSSPAGSQSHGVRRPGRDDQVLASLGAPLGSRRLGSRMLGRDGMEFAGQGVAAWNSPAGSRRPGLAAWAREGRASEGNGGQRRRTGSARWRWKPRRFSPMWYASFLGPSVRGSTSFLEEETVSRSSLTSSPHQQKKMNCPQN